MAADTNFSAFERNLETGELFRTDEIGKSLNLLCCAGPQDRLFPWFSTTARDFPGSLFRPYDTATKCAVLDTIAIETEHEGIYHRLKRNTDGCGLN